MKCELLLKEESQSDEVDIFVTYIKSPAFILAGRLFIDGRYMMRDPIKEHYIVMFSSKGNENIAKQYIDKNDTKGSALAYSVISGHWYMPLLD